MWEMAVLFLYLITVFISMTIGTFGIFQPFLQCLQLCSGAVKLASYNARTWLDDLSKPVDS